MISRVLLLLSRQRWTYQIRKGFHWVTIVGIVVLLSPVNAISNSRNPPETLKRESRRLRSGPHNFNHNPFNVNYNRMNSAFSHPSSLRGPLNNPYHNNNDLSASAQTLYDLRGFHIPLAGQEETQRFLRQQNHLQQQQPDHQTTPLVFPSFFQPQQHQQQRHETQPQAINIFGHNQHHQQTHRFRLQENDNNFRPSQPDLGVTTTTENVFRPIQPVESAQLQSQDQQRLTDETPSTEEVYVYDDADYQLEPEQPVEKVPTQKSKPISTTLTDNGNNAVEANVEEVPEEVFQVQEEPQTFRLRELPPVTPNRFFKQNNRQPKNNPFNIFETQSGNEISSQIHTRPNVEIVPSSERKPPDHVDTISPPSGSHPDQENRLVFQNENRKSRFPVRFTRPVPSELPVAQELPILQEEPLRVFQAPQKPQFSESPNLQVYERNPYQQTPLDERNQQRLEEPFQEVTTNAENEGFFQNEPIIIQKINPYVSQQERFRPPQRIRPTNIRNPQLYLDNPQPTQLLDEEDIEPIEEIVPTNPPPLRTRTTTATTEIPKKLEIKSLRPFSIRNRVPTLATTTTTTTTTIPPTVKRKFIRPRIKQTTTELTTTTATTTTTSPSINFLPTVKQIDYYESEEIESPKYTQQNKPAPTIRSRGTPLIRTRTTTTTKPQVTKLPTPRISVQRELQFQQHETPSSSPPEDSSREIVYEPRNRPGPAFQDPRFHQNDFDQPPFHVFNENFAPEFHGRPPPQQQFRYNNPPRFRQQPPPQMFTGKPLYITGKMLGKEGGLYAGQVIPPGFNYGNPIPLLPINTVIERIPSGGDGRVSFQQNPQVSVSPYLVRQRQNIPRISPANENNGISLQQPKTLISNVQEREENSLNVLHIQRARPRPPTRRKIRPNPQREQQVVQPHRESDKSSNREHETKILLTTNEVNPSAPPRLVSNPPRRRPKRPRIKPVAVNSPATAPDEQSQSLPTLRQSSVTKSPKIRPRIRVRQQRPTSVTPLNTPQSLISDTTHSPTVITQSSVQIFRKPTEVPRKYSSRYRDENVLSTPTPTLPTSPESISKPQQESTSSRRPAIKTNKNIKIHSPITIKQSTTSTSTESSKPKPIITVRPKPKALEVEDGLPPSIYLSPKDVLTNRKPARRIPAGSYSDRIKALSARRKNNKLRGTPIKETQSKEVQQSNSEDEEDDEVYSQSSNIEQVQNKREISTHRHKTLSTQKFQNDIKVPDANLKPDMALENSTEANSEETMSVLGIPQPTENTQLDSPQLISLSDEDGGEIETQRPLLFSRPEGKHTKTNQSSSPLFNNNDQKYSTKSPFNIFTMSTEEPSLPLEAYFPIVSQQ